MGESMKLSELHRLANIAIEEDPRNGDLPVCIEESGRLLGTLRCGMIFDVDEERNATPECFVIEVKS